MSKSKQKSRRSKRLANTDDNNDDQHMEDDNQPTDGQQDDNILDLDTDSSDTEVNTKDQSSKCKPKLQIFKGMGDKISIENWLKRYEMIASHLKWSPNDRVVMLGNYLEDDALNWYIENSSNNYSDIKNKLINRFGVDS